VPNFKGKLKMKNPNNLIVNQDFDFDLYNVFSINNSLDFDFNLKNIISINNSHEEDENSIDDEIDFDPKLFLKLI
jgi:hypothetical protein